MQKNSKQAKNAKMDERPTEEIFADEEELLSSKSLSISDYINKFRFLG